MRYLKYSLLLALVLVLAACGQTATPDGAGLTTLAVTFDAETGEGFVGKGEVQTAFGWNNRELQRNADSVEFRASSEVVTEVSWICTNSNNQNVQERERTTTTTVQGVVDATTRDRNQVTGFTLLRYDGNPEESSTTGGNQLNSCPSGPWTLTSPAGDPEMVSSSTTLQVRLAPEGQTPGRWIDLD